MKELRDCFLPLGFTAKAKEPKPDNSFMGYHVFASSYIDIVVITRFYSAICKLND
jgi:hypothetical protein